MSPTDRRTLAAILLNPPVTTGTRTSNAVARAGRALGYQQVLVVNLCSLPTRSVVELNATSSAADWARARDELASAIQHCSGILGGWGISGLTGIARQARDDQLAWLRRTAVAADLENIWMLDGSPRHPSRWHQYVSDKYSRTTGGTFDARLSEMLVSVPIASVDLAGDSSQTRV